MVPAAFNSLLACPHCRSRLDQTLRCAGCGSAHDCDGGIPDLRLPGDPRTEAYITGRFG